MNELIDELHIELDNAVVLFLQQNFKAELFSLKTPELNMPFSSRVKIAFNNPFNHSVDSPKTLLIPFALSSTAVLSFKDSSLIEFRAGEKDLFLDFSRIPKGLTVLEFDFNSVISSAESDELLFVSQEKGVEKSGAWFARLGAFFDERFGGGWKNKDKKFWNEFDKTFKVSKDEIEKWAQYQEMMIHAIENYSVENMDLVYNRVLSLYPVDAVMMQLIVPLFEELGRRWDKWEGGIAEEHFASTYLRNKLGVRLNEEPAVPSAKPFIATCFPQEQHELGLILFCLAALSQGYRPMYLGPNLPFQQLPAAAESSRSVAVVLSAKFPQRATKRLIHDLKALRENLALPIFVGGKFAADNIQDISAANAIPLELDLKQAVKNLDSVVKKK